MPRAFTDDERDHVRDRLRTAAAARVAQVGYRRTTVGELARAAGISKGAFYRFYDSKEALFVEILQDAEADQRRRLQHAARLEGPPREVLHAVLGQLRSIVAEHPLIGVLANPEESAALFRHLPPGFLKEAQADDDRWFAGLFGDLARRGVVDADRVPVLVALPRLLFAVAQGRQWLGDDFDPTTRLLVDALSGHLGAEP
ncbi:MAG: TetR/AcrR family transcriptional regulator [Myxococcota bacterium]